MCHNLPIIEKTQVMINDCANYHPDARDIVYCAIFFTYFDYISCDFVFHHESFKYMMTLHCIILHFFEVVY